MSHLPIETWVRAARVYAAERAAWFAPALYAAPLRLSERLPTPAAIDKHGRVYFNPRWVARLYAQAGQDKHALVQQLGFLWYHELMHWLRRHGERAEAIRAEPELWNLACDMEINDYLPEGLARPDFGEAFKAVSPQDYGFDEGHTAEWYYRRLQEQSQSQEQEQSSGGDTGENEPSAGETNGVWDEGSGVHGQPRPWELPADSPDAPPPSPTSTDTPSAKPSPAIFWNIRNTEERSLQDSRAGRRNPQAQSQLARAAQARRARGD